MKKMRSREIVVPRNVPVENFTSAWSDTSEKSSSCSFLKLSVYIVIILLVLVILGVVIFLVFTGRIESIRSQDGSVLNSKKGETSLSSIYKLQKSERAGPHPIGQKGQLVKSQILNFCAKCTIWEHFHELLRTHNSD